MSEVNFTPAPWKFNAHDGSITDCTKAENEIATAQLDDWHHLGMSYANAHLIAAAPSMYAMLEEVTKELYNLIDEVNDQRLSHVHASSLTQPDLCDYETIHNIQLLLAKARGE